MHRRSLPSLLLYAVIAGTTTACATTDATPLRTLGEAPALSRAALGGRVVVLNLWASWCAPCRTELPALAHLARQFREAPVTILALNVEADSLEGRRYVEQQRLQLPVLFVGPRATGVLGARGIPATIVLDGTGRERGRWLGFTGDAQMSAIATTIHALLSETSARHTSQAPSRQRPSAWPPMLAWSTPVSPASRPSPPTRDPQELLP